MRNMYRSKLFSLNLKTRITLDQVKRYFMIVLLIMIVVIYLAQNISSPPKPQINGWEYYQRAFEQAK